jgi:hypothetical protein
MGPLPTTAWMLRSHPDTQTMPYVRLLQKSNDAATETKPGEDVTV